MKEPKHWNKFISETVPASQREALRLSFRKLMAGIAFVSSDLPRPLDQPGQDGGGFLSE